MIGKAIAALRMVSVYLQAAGRRDREINDCKGGAAVGRAFGLRTLLRQLTPDFVSISQPRPPNGGCGDLFFGESRIRKGGAK